MSVISDPKMMRFTPTNDPKAIVNKKYYYFSKPKLDNGEVSKTYVPTHYNITANTSFATYIINDVQYRIRIDIEDIASHDLASLIIYEAEGELIDLLQDINGAINVIEDTERAESLTEVRDLLETIKMQSWTTVLNPFKMHQSYQALVTLRDMIAAGRLDPKLIGTEGHTDEDVVIYRNILNFY
jgi:hypothetical protein